MRRRTVLAIAAAACGFCPATAAAAPTVTVTGDDGRPLALNTATPTGLRNMSVQATVSVPTGDAAFYTTQVLDAAGTPASAASPCLSTRSAPRSTSAAAYHGNGTYTVLLRYFRSRDPSCARGARAEQRFRYAINAGTGVTAPPDRLLTRPPGSLLTNTHPLPVALNPGAGGYEVRYALDGAPAPDGGIAGLSAEAPVNSSTGLADFLFDKPGRYRVVARAKAGQFVTPWSAAVDVNAIAPFDLAKVTFPDARGPRYRLRGVVRERAARGRVAISVARGRREGRYRRIGTARIGAKGRFTRRFRLKHTGIFRIRYTYKGSDLVAAGRVVDRIRIRR